MVCKFCGQEKKLVKAHIIPKKFYLGLKDDRYLCINSQNCKYVIQQQDGYDSNIYRKDLAGAWIKYKDYGKTSSDTNFGWEIDHKIPESKGGSDDLSNLEPLQWRNNRTKGDDYPIFKTSISSEGTHNICKEQSWKFNT